MWYGGKGCLYRVGAGPQRGWNRTPVWLWGRSARSLGHMGELLYQ